MHFDLRMLHVFVSIVNFLVPESNWLNLKEAVHEFTTTMEKQIDLRIEAENLKQFNDNFQNQDLVTFPKVIEPYVSKNVLIETYEHGNSISNYINIKQKSNNNVSTKLAKIGLDAYLEMMLVHNFVHADLHPGNILVRRGPSDLQLVFLDCGLVTKLTDKDWDHFKQLFTAIINGDGKYGASLMIKYADEAKISLEEEEQFTEAMDQLFKKLRISNIAEIHVADFVTSVFQLTRKFKVKIKGTVTTLIVGTAILEGIGRQLSPDLNILDRAVPLLIRNPDQLSHFPVLEYIRSILKSKYQND